MLTQSPRTSESAAPIAGPHPLSLLRALSPVFDTAGKRHTSHAARTAILAERIAKEQGIGKTERLALRMAALVIDAGWCLPQNATGHESVPVLTSLRHRLVPQANPWNQVSIDSQLRFREARRVAAALNLPLKSQDLLSHVGDRGSSHSRSPLADLLWSAHSLDIEIGRKGVGRAFDTLERHCGVGFNPVFVEAAWDLRYDGRLWARLLEESSAPNLIRWHSDEGLDASDEQIDCVFGNSLDLMRGMPLEYSQRVSALSIACAQALGMPPAVVKDIGKAALLNGLATVRESSGADFLMPAADPIELIGNLTGYGNVSELLKEFRNPASRSGQLIRLACLLEFLEKERSVEAIPSAASFEPDIVAAFKRVLSPRGQRIAA